MGSHVTYKVCIKLHKTIGSVIPWPVIMSESCIEGWNYIIVLYTDGSRYVDRVVLVYSLDVIFVQIAVFSRKVVFRKLMCFTVGKVKWSRYRPGVAQRVGRGIALLFHDRGTGREWVVSSTPRTHFTPGKDPVPIVQEAGWAPGPVWTGGKSRPHRDSIPDRPASSSVAIPTELLFHGGRSH